MEITSSTYLQEVKSLTKEMSPGVSQEATNPVGGNFADLLEKAINSVSGLQNNASDLATRLDSGDKSVSLSDMVIAREKAGIAFDAALQVRNKIVDSYKEIMNMSL